MVSSFPRKHAHLLQRRPSLPFGFGICLAKDRASLSLDGLRKDYPKQCPIDSFGINLHTSYWTLDMRICHILAPTAWNIMVHQDYGAKDGITFRFQRRRYAVRWNRLLADRFCLPVRSQQKRLYHNQERSKRSRFITLFHAATKSCTNFSWESSHA